MDVELRETSYRRNNPPPAYDYTYPKQYENIRSNFPKDFPLSLKLVSHILQYLSVSDRKEAALVCSSWYTASLDPRLQRDVIVRCQPPSQSNVPPTGLVQRRLTHLVVEDWEGSSLSSEDQFVAMLGSCPSLVGLDISRCNTLFMTGKLLEKEKDRATLKQVLSKVRELKLGCLRHMSDVTFLRLVSTMERLDSLALTSANMIFGSGLYDINGTSSAMLNFTTVLKYIKGKAKQLKKIDLSRTAIHNDALTALAQIENLSLEEMVLQGCIELSDTGIKSLVSLQPNLQLLDISGCKELGTSKAFFANFARLSKLHTLTIRKCPKVGQCDLYSLNEIKTLKNIDIGETLNVFDKDIIKGLCGPVERLKSVSLPFCPDLNDVFVMKLCEHNSSLTHLDLTSCLKLTDLSLHTITSNLTSLRTLRMAYCTGISDMGILGYIPEKGGACPRHVFDHDHEGCSCSRPRESKIFNKPTGMVQKYNEQLIQLQSKMQDGESFNMLSTLTKLQVLDLSSCSRVTDFGVSKAVCFKELRSLALNNMPKVSNDAVRAVARQNPSLEDVSLRGNANITDESVRFLISSCPRLSRLDISQCDKLTDETLNMLSRQGKRLRHLDISFCGGVSQDKVASIEHLLPNVKVVFRPYIY